jgi:phage terminase Nu1 subunit (DNA packaging protein)
VKARGDQAVQTSALSPVPPPPTGSAGAIPDGQADVDAGAELTLSQASAEEKRWKAKIAEQEYRKRAGELIDAREVVDRVTHLFTVCRTQLLALPSKAKQVIPDLSHDHVRLLDDLVRQSLEELSVSRVTGSGTGAAA